MFYIRFGKSGESEVERVELDFLSFDNIGDRDEAAGWLRFLGYWTYCFDEDENQRHIKEQIEVLTKKLI